MTTRRTYTLLAIVALITLGGAISLLYPTETSSDPQLERPTYVDDLQWHRMVMRGGIIEPEKMVKGRQIAQKRFKKRLSSGLEKDAGIRSWTEVGPNKIGGRIRAIAISDGPGNEETIYIGAAGGGIWKSSDSGDNWTAMSDFNPSLAVTSIVIHPSNPNILYASTGEGHVARTMGIPGAGIFKSTNAGNTWTQLSATNNEKFYWVNKLAINPSNGNHILAVTSNVNKDGGLYGDLFNGGGELYESTNGGTSWTLVLSDDFLTDVEFHPTISDRRVVAGHGTLKVYNSTTQQYEEKVTGAMDEIPNWTGRIEAAISPLGAAYVIYALVNPEDEPGSAFVFRSTNGGDTWEFRSSHRDIFTSSSFGNYSNTIIVDPADNLNGIYLGGLDLWKSDNGGTNFTKISNWQQYHAFLNADEYEDITQLHADQHIIVPSPNFTQNNQVMYIGNDGGIQKSDDMSSANDGLLSGWDNLLGSGLGITQFYGADASPHNSSLGGGAQDNGIIMRRNSQWRQPETGDGSDMVFHPNDPNIVYANNNYQNLKKSMDGGATFTTVASLGESLAPLIAPIAINKQNTNILYLGGYGLYQYSDSNGQVTLIKDTLIHFSSNTPYITALVSEDNNRSLWVGYSNGVVEYSLNGGLTWSGDITNSTSSGQPNTAVTDIDVYSLGPNGLDAFVTFGGYRDDHIWHHTLSNGSSNWVDRSLDFEMQVNTITRHPSNKEWVYVGTDVGIFASHDGGANWSVDPLYSLGSNPNQANEGPLFTEVTDLFWDFESFSQGYSLYAATFGRGIWSTSYILDEVFVDKNTADIFNWGTRTRPVKSVTNAIGMAENKGSDVIILNNGNGTYNEISSPKVFDKKVLIKTEMSSGSSAIIE